MKTSSLIRFVMTMILAIMSHILLSQDSLSHHSDTVTTISDTTKARQILEDIRNSKVSKKIVKSITRKQQTNPGATIRSEDFFTPFEGRIIRNIFIQRVGFEKSIIDTTRRVKTTITRIANRLHHDTKEWVIRDNLFIREGRPVNPYKVADNERYLRDLDFIQDAKIFIEPLEGTEDSVDVIVMTRDVFSIGGSFHPSSPTKSRVKLYDANLFGMGQRIQYNTLVDNKRAPAFGHEIMYRKNSLGGSFITATAGYTQLNTGSSYGHEQEEAYYIKLDRPLVSPYTRFAGGVELSRNWSANYYGLPDTIFRDYRYVINDFWVGYNFTAKAALRNRSRHFLSFRMFDQHFTRPPLQDGERLDPIYSNRTYALLGFTFFKQNFYTARYIYGFGRTEDVPYGHMISVYAGWTKHVNIKRPYVGLDVGHSVVSRKGQFYNILLRAGGYNDRGLEDAAILLSGTMTSRLISWDKWLMRQIVGGDFTRVYNQRTNLPLDINNEFGVRGFVADSLFGTKRFHLNSETVAFTPYDILGFKLAPFVYGEMAWLCNKKEKVFADDPYFGFGGGVRTRNENLVFGTIEFRFLYYPNTVENISKFNFRITSNLRVKYTASFVKPPSFVTYN